MCISDGGCSGSGSCLIALVNRTTTDAAGAITGYALVLDDQGTCVCHTGYSGRDLIRASDDCQVVEVAFDILCLLTLCIYSAIIIRAAQALFKSLPWWGPQAQTRDLFTKTKLVFYGLVLVSSSATVVQCALLYVRLQYTHVARAAHLLGLSTHFPSITLATQMWLMTVPRGHLAAGSFLKRLDVGIGTAFHAYIIAAFCFVQIFVVGFAALVNESLAVLAFDMTMVSAAVWTMLIGPSMLIINSSLISHLGELMAVSAVSAKSLAGPRSKMVRVFWLNVVATIFCVFCFLAAVIWPLATHRLYAVYLPVTIGGGLIVLAATFLFTFSSTRSNAGGAIAPVEREGEVKPASGPIQRRGTFVVTMRVKQLASAAAAKYRKKHRSTGSMTILSSEGGGLGDGGAPSATQTQMGSGSQAALEMLLPLSPQIVRREPVLGATESMSEMPTLPGSTAETPNDGATMMPAGNFPFIGAMTTTPGTSGPATACGSPSLRGKSRRAGPTSAEPRVTFPDDEVLAQDEYLADSDDMEEDSFSETIGQPRRPVTAFVRYTANGRAVRTRNTGATKVRASSDGDTRRIVSGAVVAPSSSSSSSAAAAVNANASIRRAAINLVGRNGATSPDSRNRQKSHSPSPRGTAGLLLRGGRLGGDSDLDVPRANFEGSSAALPSALAPTFVSTSTPGLAPSASPLSISGVIAVAASPSPFAAAPPSTQSASVVARLLGHSAVPPLTNISNRVSSPGLRPAISGTTPTLALGNGLGFGHTHAPAASLSVTSERRATSEDIRAAAPTAATATDPAPSPPTGRAHMRELL